MWQIWLIIVIILLITAFRHPSSLIICFFISSTLTFIFSLFFNNLLLEFFFFLLVALISHFFLSTHTSTFNPSSLTFHTTTDSLINQTGIVTKSISTHPFDTGLVHINKEAWIASSICPIKEGTSVKVTSVQGLRLHVTPIHKLR